MALDTKLNLSNAKFEQASGDTLYLSGTTVIYRNLQYGVNRSSFFTARSIVDAGWVTGITSTLGSSFTANNGLIKSGSNVRLGGSFTGNTTIQTSGNTTFLSFLSNGLAGFGALTPTARVDIQGATSDDTAFSFIIRKGDTTQSLSVRNDGLVNIYNLLNYNSDRSSFYTARSVPDVSWVTGQTWTLVTGATNGLSLSNKTVKLGGNITESVFLEPADGSQFFYIGQTNPVSRIMLTGGLYDYTNYGQLLLRNTVSQMTYTNGGSLYGELTMNTSQVYLASRTVSPQSSLSLNVDGTTTLGGSGLMTLLGDGVKIPSVAGSPSTLSNGVIWYNSSTHKYNFRQNSSTIEFWASSGTTTITSPIIAGDPTFNGLVKISQHTTNTTGANLQLRKSRGGSINTPSDIANGDIIGEIKFTAYNTGNGGYIDTIKIQGVVNGTTGVPTDIVFSSKHNENPYTDADVKLRIRSVSGGVSRGDISIGLAAQTPTMTSSLLDVATMDSSLATRLVSLGQHSNDAVGGILRYKKTRGGSISGGTTVVNGDSIGTVTFAPFVSSAGFIHTAQIRGVVNGTVTSLLSPTDIVFETHNSAINHGNNANIRQRLTSTGLAGFGDAAVGTGTTVAQLHVGNTTLTNTTRGVIVSQHTTDTTASSLAMLKSRGASISTPTTVANSDFVGAFQFKPYVSTTGYILGAGITAKVNGTVNATTAPVDLRFWASAASGGATSYDTDTKMLLTSGGLLGVGSNVAVAAPTVSAQVHVATTTLTDTTRGVLISQHDTAATGAFMAMRKSRGASVASPTTIANGDSVGSLYFYPYVTTSGYIGTNAITSIIQGTVTSTAAPTDMTFYTSSAAVAATDIKFRIASTNNIGMGAAALSNTGTTTWGVHIGHNIADASKRGLMVGYYGTDNLGSVVIHRKSRGSISAPITVTNGDIVMQHTSNPYITTGGYISTAGALTLINGTVNTTQAPTDYCIWTSLQNTSNVLNDIKFRVTSAGGVAIGFANNTITSNTRVDVKGFGVTSATTILRLANSGNTEYVKIRDDGAGIFGGNILVGGTTFTTNTRYDIRGTDTTAAHKVLRLANSSNDTLFTVGGDGSINSGAASLGGKLTINAGIYAYAAKFGNNADVNILGVNTAGVLYLGASSQHQIGFSDTDSTTYSLSGKGLVFVNTAIPSNNASNFAFKLGVNNNSVSGTTNLVSIKGTASTGLINPSSGNGNFNSLNVSPNYTITGTHSGTVRGIYYDPTINSIGTGSTHYAFESTNGRFKMQNANSFRVVGQSPTSTYPNVIELMMSGATSDELGFLYIDGISATIWGQSSESQYAEFDADAGTASMRSFKSNRQLSLVFNSNTNTATFTDGRTVKKGLEYAGTYESGFTANSLVTKRYVTGLTPTVTRLRTFRFESDLFTEHSMSFRGIITSLNDGFTAELSSISYESRLDSSSSWTSHANISALQTWINSNITGTELSGTKFWIKCLATYGVGKTGVAENNFIYTPS